MPAISIINLTNLDVSRLSNQYTSIATGVISCRWASGGSAVLTSKVDIKHSKTLMFLIATQRPTVSKGKHRTFIHYTH